MVRIAVALILGAGAAMATWLAEPAQHFAPAVGWITAASVYLVWTWLTVLPLDAAGTEEHLRRQREDGNPRLSHAVVLIASIASLAGVGHLLAASSNGGTEVAEALVGVLSIVASWFAVHTTFMLRYAMLYYFDAGDTPVSFNQDGYRPRYTDFAYLAFTVGMTYQVSDTNLAGRHMRGAVLAQALVSFLLGAIVLASTVNLVLELASR